MCTIHLSEKYGNKIKIKEHILIVVNAVKKEGESLK